MATRTSLSAADRARLAHRVLRLKEKAVEDEQLLKALSTQAKRSSRNQVQGLIDMNGVATVNSLQETAKRVIWATDPNEPGPTDHRFVWRLFDMPITDIWEVWNEAVLENLQENAPKDLKAVEAQAKRDAETISNQMAEREESGDWDVHPAFGHNRHTVGAATGLYDFGRQGYLDGDIDWTTASFKVYLIDSADYAVNFATDQFLSSIAASAREEVSVNLSGKTSAAGVADANDLLPAFPAATGDDCEALVIVQTSAVTGGVDVADTAKRLVGYIDNANGLPITLTGGDVNITWDNGAFRIFKL